MQLTKKTDYCFRVLIFLQCSKDRIKIKDLAEKLDVSKNHLSLIVNRLAELGYISTISGPSGGIVFNEEARERSLVELIYKFENFDLVECFDSKSNTCNLTPKCKLKNILSKANDAFLKEVSKYKIKDLV